MITIESLNHFGNTITMYGLSTDEKPTESFEFEKVTYKVRNGSVFYETDNSAVYIFDEENKQWIEQ